MYVRAGCLPSSIQLELDCLPSAGTKNLPCSRRFCIGELATRSVLWKNHLDSCDDELEQKNVEVGLRLLQLSRSDVVRPGGQELWAEK